MMLWLIGVCGRPLTYAGVCGADRFAVTTGSFSPPRARACFCLGPGVGLWRSLWRWLLAGHRLGDRRRHGRRLCFGCVIRGHCLRRRLLFWIGADDLRLRLRLRRVSLMRGAGSTLASVGVSLRFLTSKLVARGTMEDVVVMSGSSVTCFTSSGGGGGNAGDVTSVGASGSGVSASIPAGAGATGLAICCGMSSGGTSMGLVAPWPASPLPAPGGLACGLSGRASTFGWAEVVAGSARCFGKIGEGCTTSTSIAGGALLPGPGSVISIGSMAATQSPCTAPAPSTQSGRVIERLSVKGRSFRGAAALPPPTSASS